MSVGVPEAQRGGDAGGETGWNNTPPTGGDEDLYKYTTGECPPTPQGARGIDTSRPGTRGTRAPSYSRTGHGAGRKELGWTGTLGLRAPSPAFARGAEVEGWYRTWQGGGLSIYRVGNSVLSHKQCHLFAPPPAEYTDADLVCS